MTNNYKRYGLLPTLCFVAMAVPAVAQDRATGAQIEALLSGNTLQGCGEKICYAEYYEEDGTIRADGYVGKWKVDGNQGCMDYGEGFSCWTVLIDENANIWYKDGSVSAAGLMVPGNPKDY